MSSIFVILSYLQHGRPIPGTLIPPIPVSIPQENRCPVTSLHLEDSPAVVANLMTYVSEVFQRQIEYVRHIEINLPKKKQI